MMDMQKGYNERIYKLNPHSFQFFEIFKAFNRFFKDKTSKKRFFNEGTN
jgi:hypothetical protein